VSAVRLDSGDLGQLATAARRMLDEAGLADIGIFASGGLDEHLIAALVEAGAPITAFGVGTSMGISSDQPSLDMVYKLAEYAGRARLKLSAGKPVLPGRKQVFRQDDGSGSVRDVIARLEERLPGRPLLQPVMRDGRRLAQPDTDLASARRRAERGLAVLPGRIRALAPAEPGYPVEVSASLLNLQREAEGRVHETERRSS
jgi:nicotinate phosphoribosyltransferase